MTYKIVLEGLEEALAAVVGIKTTARGEPNSVHMCPMLYSAFDSFDEQDSDNSHLEQMTWRTLHRLVLQDQDPTASENELIGFLESIPDAIAADPKLGGRLHHTGYARITRGDAGFTTIDGIQYRTCDFYSEVLEVGNA